MYQGGLHYDALEPIHTEIFLWEVAVEKYRYLDAQQGDRNMLRGLMETSKNLGDDYRWFSCLCLCRLLNAEGSRLVGSSSVGAGM